MARKPSYRELLARIKELENKVSEKNKSEEVSLSSGKHDVADEPSRTKEELFDQLRFIETLFNTIPNPVFYKNKIGIYLGCNQSFSNQILGLPPERIIGRSLYDFPDVIPKERADIYFKQDLELLENPGSQYSETKVRCADGELRDFLFYKATYKNAMGDVAGIVGLMLDVTERNRIQLALRESEEKYRSMMESMNDAVYICAPDFRISYMNSKMRARIGYDAVDQKCHKVLHDLEEPCAWCTFSKVIEGEITEIEIVSPRDGHTYIVTSSPIFHQDGSISKMTIYRDITQRKRVEDELLMAKKIEATGVFAGGIAHDYNNLLFIILGNLLMLKKDMKTGSEPYQLLQFAEDAAQKAAKLTRRLLAFTHGESLTLEEYDLERTLEDIVKGVDRKKKYEIELQIPKGIKRVFLDVSLISIVMINLIANAMEAMVDGGTILISASMVSFGNLSEQAMAILADKPCDYVCISVTDTGTGIEKHILPKIFDPYFSTKRRGDKKGLGLGLSISYSIVKKHSGALLVDSKEGVATTASIYLPVERQGSENIAKK